MVFAISINTFAQTELSEQYFKEGKELAKAEKFVKANESYDKSLKVVKNDKKLKSKIYYNIGVNFYQLKKFEDSEKAFNRAIKIDKKYVDAIYFLGLTKIELGELNSAQARFRKVIGLDRKHSEAWFDLGVVLMMQKKYKVARIVFAKSIEYETVRLAKAQKYLEDINALQSKNQAI